MPSRRVPPTPNGDPGPFGADRWPLRDADTIEHQLLAATAKAWISPVSFNVPLSLPKPFVTAIVHRRWWRRGCRQSCQLNLAVDFNVEVPSEFAEVEEHDVRENREMEVDIDVVRRELLSRGARASRVSASGLPIARPVGVGPLERLSVIVAPASVKTLPTAYGAQRQAFEIDAARPDIVDRRSSMLGPFAATVSQRDRDARRRRRPLGIANQRSPSWSALDNAQKP
jgi:hypothetical protein